MRFLVIPRNTGELMWLCHPEVKSKKQSAGFALVALLIFMQIFMLLGIFGLTTASMTFKTTQHHWKRQYYLHISDQLFHRLENIDYSTFSYCTIQLTPSYRLAYEESGWWLKNGCTGKFNEVTYSFIIEPLEKDACATFNVPNYQSLIPMYYRITLAILDAKNQDTKSIVQRTITKLTQSQGVCAEEKRMIRLGYQSMRILK